MRQIIILLLLMVWAMPGFSEQSPHGKRLRIECKECHQPDGWVLRRDATFNHDKTRFKLKGQHKMLSCKQCHKSLVFSEVSTDCASCHKDVHEGTVGHDCVSCHNNNSWIVKNVKQMHQQRGFSLAGAHATAECNFCHKSGSSLRFNNLNSECVACHRQQYESAQISSPDIPANKNTHRGFGFGTDCFKCHNMVGENWSYNGRGFEHGFFPLVGGHKLECVVCHVNGFSVKLSPKCIDCHNGQYDDRYTEAKASVPAHNNNSKIGKYECAACHNSYGWNSVKFGQHEGWFKIRSGDHKGIACLDCHYNTYSYDAGCKRCHD